MFGSTCWRFRGSSTTSVVSMWIRESLPPVWSVGGVVGVSGTTGTSAGLGSVLSGISTATPESVVAPGLRGSLGHLSFSESGLGDVVTIGARYLLMEIV